MESLFKFLEHKCKEYKDKIIFNSTDGHTLSYSEFFLETEKSLASFSKRKENLGNFSIIAPNCTNYLFFLFTALKEGGKAINLNPSLTNTEIKERLILGQVSVLATTESIYNKLKVILNDTGIKTVFIISEDSFLFKEPQLISLNPNLSFKDNVKSDVAFLQFTGGTTGIIKMAEITNQNILANIKQLHEHFSKYRNLDNIHIIVAFPFYHIFSLVFNVLFFINNGSTCYLHQNLRDTAYTLEILKHHPINFTVAVNTWYKKLMQHPEFKHVNTSKIETSLAGGEYVPVSTKSKWQSLTGKPLFSAYGLTETCSLAIVSPLDKSNQENSIGIPLPGTEVMLFDERNNIVLSDNQAGELALKGPQVIQGYYLNPGETEKAFYKDWFKTGDIAERLNGRLYKIVDRKKDMISVSGNKVYPNEVEGIISKLADVLDVGVVAKRSEKSGEEVAACIVIKEESSIQDNEILDYCRLFLSKYKIPKHIYRYKDLPKTAIGKTARRILKKDINGDK